MADNAEQVYKTRATIISELLATLLTRIPDANTGPDAIWRILIELMATPTEGLLLAQQLLHDDMFIQTQSALALIRAGEQYGRPQKAGVVAIGSVRFSGAGGTYIGIGAVVSSPRPATEDALDFVTTAAGTIPNPGDATAPVATDNGAGAMAAGTYEYAVTFLTVDGETELGAVSNALVQVINKKVHLAAIPVGGAGTTKRRIYRRVNGGVWGFLVDIADNVTLVYDDNIVATGGGTPPVDSTAERLTLAASATDVGVEYNVAIGSVTDLSDVPLGISDVTNLVAFTGGTDPEDIETFRGELLKWVRAPMSGSKEDLEAWAESIDGIETATAFENTTTDPNLLTLNEASVETNVADWANYANAGLAQTAAQAADGTKSLQLTAASAADMGAVLAASKVSVPGTTYTGLAQFRTAVTARQVRVGIQWRDAADAVLSVTWGNQLADSNAGFTQVIVSGIAPTGATKMRLVAYVLAPGNTEVHYVDKMLLVKGVITTWTPGGTVLNPAPGHTTIRITGPNGSLPSAGLQATVLSTLLAHDLANISLHVATFDPINVDVTVAITLADTYVLADVTPNVTAAITDYINSVPVNGTVYKSGIIDSVFGLAGVKNVTTTFVDQALGATEKGVPHTIAVT